MVGSAPQIAVPGHRFGTPQRAESIISYETVDTPGRKAARARLMKAMLPRFFVASDDFFEHLCKDPVDVEIWEAERQGFKDAFNAYRKHFVSDITEPIVDHNFVLDTMKLERSAPSFSNAFNIISAANLVSLLDDISVTDPEDFLPLLQEWDSVFPEFFVSPESGNNDRETNEQIIDQVLMIRTQLSIFTLRYCKNNSQAPFHPLEQIAKIWCDGDASAEAIEALANNKDAVQLKPIAAADAEAASLARERNFTRFNSLCKMLPKEPIQGDNLDLAEFYQLYPVEEFVQNLRAFVTTSFTHIRTALTQAPWAGRDVASSLAPSDAASRVGSQIRSQLETDAMAHPFDRADSG